MLSVSSRLGSLTLVALFTTACGDDGSTPTTDDTTGTATASEPTTDATDASDAASDTVVPTTGEPEPEPFVPGPVRGGLEIDWVEANQGVGVAIARDGAGVGGDGRSSYLIQNRVTLIRAFWKAPPEDWVERKIEGRLTVIYPDKTELVLVNRPTVKGESFIGALDRSFHWGLMADQVVPGIRFNIELFEFEPGFEDLPEGTNPPRIPHTGNAFVGIEDSDQVMKVTLIPVNYKWGTCNTEPDISDETMKVFTDLLYMTNPLDRLDFTIRESIDWTTELTNFHQLNSHLSKMRGDDGAEEERYYYGLIDPCSGGVNGAGGQAFGIPQGAKKSDAYQRVSSGISASRVGVSWASETFVHEVGHSQGRFHVRCNGEEGGPDHSYPWEGGVINDWGFGVINFKLYHPTLNKDYMTYCSPTWASSWGWNKVYPIIQELSSWDDETEGARLVPDDPIVPILVGAVAGNGDESWISVRGGIHPQQLSAVHKFEFVRDGEVITQPAMYQPMPEGDGFLIVTALPDRWDAVTAMTRISDDIRVPVNLAKIDHANVLSAAP